MTDKPMAHEDTALTIVRHHCGDEWDQHQLLISDITSALQAAAAEATERVLGESLRDRAVVNEAPTGSSPSGLPSLSQGTELVDRAKRLLEQSSKALAGATSPDHKLAVLANYGDIGLSLLSLLCEEYTSLRERDRNPKGGDFLGSVEDESPVSEGNSPND